MSFKGKGVYNAGPGGIEKDGDFGYRIDGDQWTFAQFCPKFGVCLIKIQVGEPNQANAIWGWDGDIEHPTIKPSIGCDLAPRCGRHKTVVKGEFL